MADEGEIRALISRRRAQVLVHRYLYYVLNQSLINDFDYDMLERELAELVAAYPDIAATARYAEDCPVGKVGSSRIEDYPRYLQCVAHSLLSYDPVEGEKQYREIMARKAEAAESEPLLSEGEQGTMFG